MNQLFWDPRNQKRMKLLENKYAWEKFFYIAPTYFFRPVTKKPAMEVISTSTLSYDVNEEDQPLPATQPKENITSKNKTNNTPLVTSPKIESSPVKHVPHLVKSTDPITQGSKPSNANEAKAETPKPIISNSQPSMSQNACFLFSIPFEMLFINLLGNLVSPPIIRTKQFNNSTWAAISKKDQSTLFIFSLFFFFYFWSLILCSNGKRHK